MRKLNEEVNSINKIAFALTIYDNEEIIQQFTHEHNPLPLFLGLNSKTKRLLKGCVAVTSTVLKAQKKEDQKDITVMGFVPNKQKSKGTEKQHRTF